MFIAQSPSKSEVTFMMSTECKSTKNVEGDDIYEERIRLFSFSNYGYRIS